MVQSKIGLILDKNEAKNQHVHMFWGLLMVHAALTYGAGWLAYLIPLIWAIVLESWQYFFADRRELKLADRLFDSCFWVLGGLVNIAFQKGLL